VCQVGYLPELYEDARSEKYKKKKTDQMLRKCSQISRRITSAQLKL